MAPAAASAKTSSSEKTALKAIAKSINIKASDVPGWTVVPNTAPNPGPVYKKEAQQCVGKKGSPKLAQVSSPSFGQGGVQVSSNVNIVATNADALGDLAGEKDPKLPGCFVRVFNDYAKKTLLKDPQLKSDHVKLGKIVASSFVPGYGLTGAVGLLVKIPFSVTVDGATSGENIYLSTIDFVVGRAEISFQLTEMGQLITVPIEPTLLNTLRQRATSVASL
ncbi:MAG TPA: hypothetical protein VGF87_07320 [Acidimicrobiales bacterium]